MSDTPGVNDYYDFAPGSLTMSMSWSLHPRAGALRERQGNEDGNDINTSEDVYPHPPTDGTWQRELW